METVTRKPFQGVGNIIRFNWHFYVLAAVLIMMLLIARRNVSGLLIPGIDIVLLLIGLSLTVTLAVSWYIYDHAGLYTLDWLNGVKIVAGNKLVNINAGFDETSTLLAAKYPDAHLTVFDFYDPAKHTEVSIERARRAYPAYPGTQVISTNILPLMPASVDVIFAILAAHEIRDRTERIAFFRELGKSLTMQGKLIVLEHLRDIPNFLAYNIGCFHFFSKKEWQHTFRDAGLVITREMKITPFLSAFILQKNGITA